MTRWAGLLWACVILSVFTWNGRAHAASVDLPNGFTVPADFREDPTRRKYWDFDQVESAYVPAGRVVAVTAVRHRWPSILSWAMSRLPAGT